MRARDAVALLVAVILTNARAVGAQEPLRAPGMVEGRPALATVSPVQQLIDRAAPGSRLEIPPGTYVGDLVIDKRLTLVGRSRPTLVGSGTGSVVRVRADEVTIDGFDIDGREGGDLGRDSSGIHIAARDVTIRDCRIVDAIFGIYLRQANGARIDHCRIRGIPGKTAGEKGSGIHVWNTDGFTLTRNEIREVRDGFYIQSSPNGRITGNVVGDLRYGLHYMYSDDNTFEDNVFERGDAGAAVMYSRRITFRRNRLLHNRGFASVGLLLKSCDDVLAEDNLIADNARGVFLEGSARSLLRRNVIAQSDVAVVLYDSCQLARFEGNSFVANQSPLLLVGRRTDTRFEGNYWSDNRQPDLDGDGRSDRPYRLSSVFDHLRGNLTAADLFAQGFAAPALAAAEEAFPVLQPVAVEDPRPLAVPPRLPQVPKPDGQSARPNVPGLAVALMALAIGVVLLSGGARRNQAPERQRPNNRGVS